MKYIYIVRHGQSHTNAGGHAMPNADIPLTELGHVQSEEVAEWLLETTKGDIDSITVSKYLRTQLTAKPLLNKTGLSATVLDGLQEFNYLAFDSIDGLDVEQRLQLANDYWQTAEPNFVDGRTDNTNQLIDEKQAESFNDFVSRTDNVLTHFQDMPAGTHIVYSHGLWISMLIWQILAQPTANNTDMQKFRQFELSIRARNCEVFLLTFSEDSQSEQSYPAIRKVRTRADNQINAI